MNKEQIVKIREIKKRTVNNMWDASNSFRLAFYNVQELYSAMKEIKEEDKTEKDIREENYLYDLNCIMHGIAKSLYLIMKESKMFRKTQK